MTKGILVKFISLILLVSCSSIPKEDNSLAVIVLPVEKSVEDLNAYYMYYKIYYKDINDETIQQEKYITVNPNDETYIITKIVPGIYEIYAIEQIYIKTNKVYNRIRVSNQFVANSGVIKILEQSIKISLIESEDGVFRQHVEFVITDEKIYNTTKSSIKDVAGIEGWIIQ